MSNLVIRLGDAYLLKPPEVRKEHLYIAITPIPDTDKYLFVNATSYKSGLDTSCILESGPGVPDFINHKSVIKYSKAEAWNASDVLNMNMLGSPMPRGTCSLPVLRAIQKGGVKTYFLSIRYQKILKAFLKSEGVLDDLLDD